MLRHVTQRADIAFGVTYSGRPEDDVRMESVLGLFITTVPAILHVPGGGCAADFLRAVQEEAVALSAHSATPLVDILRWAGRSGGALFDALMVFENYPMDAALRDRSAAASPSALCARRKRPISRSLSVSSPMPNPALTGASTAPACRNRRWRSSVHAC